MIWHGYVDEQKPLRTLSLFSAGVTMGLFLKINIFNKDGYLHNAISDKFNKKSEKVASVTEEEDPTQLGDSGKKVQ